MQMKISNVLVGLTLSACLLVSCHDKPANGRTDTYSSGVISFASDESFSPVIDEEKQVFEAVYPQAKVKPIYTSESDGINKLLNDSIWLTFAARNFKASELKNLQDRGFRPEAVKLAYDALALIVNKNNPDTLISVQDIKKIMTGKLTRWEQLPNSKKSGQLTLVFDNNKSSTVHFIEDSILGGKPITSANVVAVKKTAQVIKYVEQNPGSIGVIGNNWLDDKGDSTNLTFNSNISVMRVSKLWPATVANSRKPYQYYIYTGEYPLIRTLYALVNDPHQGLPWGFAHFIESPKGQLIIMKAGLLPVYGNINIRDVNVSE